MPADLAAQPLVRVLRVVTILPRFAWCYSPAFGDDYHSPKFFSLLKSSLPVPRVDDSLIGTNWHFTAATKVGNANYYRISGAEPALGDAVLDGDFLCATFDDYICDSKSRHTCVLVRSIPAQIITRVVFDDSREIYRVHTPRFSYNHFLSNGAPPREFSLVDFSNVVFHKTTAASMPPLGHPQAAIFPVTRVKTVPYPVAPVGIFLRVDDRIVDLADSYADVTADMPPLQAALVGARPEVVFHTGPAGLDMLPVDDIDGPSGECLVALMAARSVGVTDTFASLYPRAGAVDLRSFDSVQSLRALADHESAPTTNGFSPAWPPPRALAAPLASVQTMSLVADHRCDFYVFSHDVVVSSVRDAAGAVPPLTYPDGGALVRGSMSVAGVVAATAVTSISRRAVWLLSLAALFPAMAEHCALVTAEDDDASRRSRSDGDPPAGTRDRLFMAGQSHEAHDSDDGGDVVLLH
jgi:hypothetical protein